MGKIIDCKEDINEWFLLIKLNVFITDALMNTLKAYFW